MKKLLISTAVLCLAFAGTASAQQVDSTGTGTASSESQAVQQTFVQTTNTGPADTTMKHTYDGGFDTTANVGNAIVSGGANQCAGGEGGGVGLTGFGINFVNAGETDGCSRRADSSGFNQLGYHFVAVARMCQEVKNADAWFAGMGTVCPGFNNWSGKYKGRYVLEDGSLAPKHVLVRQVTATTK